MPSAAILLHDISTSSEPLSIKGEMIPSDAGKTALAAGDSDENTDSVTMVTQVISQTVILDTFAATSTINVHTLAENTTLSRYDSAMSSAAPTTASDLAMDWAAETGVASNTHPTAHFKSVQYKDGILESGAGDDLDQNSAGEATMTSADGQDGPTDTSVYDQIGAVKTVPFPMNPPPTSANTNSPVHESTTPEVAGQGTSLDVPYVQNLTAAGYESAPSVPTSEAPSVAPSLAPPQPPAVQATGLAPKLLTGLALPIVPFFAVLLYVVL